MIQVTKNDRTCQNKMCQPGISRRQFPKQSDPTHPPAPLSASSPTQMNSQSSAWLTTSEKWNCFVSWLPVKPEVTSCMSLTKCPFFVYYCSIGQFLQPCLHLALFLAPRSCLSIKPSLSVRHRICSPCSSSALMKRPPLFHSFELYSSCPCSK